MEHNEYNSIVDALSRVGSIDEIREQCFLLSETAGLDLFQYGAIIPSTFTDPKVVLVSGYPPEWVEHTLSRVIWESIP